MTARRNPAPVPVEQAVARLREVGRPNAPHLAAVLDELERLQAIPAPREPEEN